MDLSPKKRCRLNRRQLRKELAEKQHNFKVGEKRKVGGKKTVSKDIDKLREKSKECQGGSSRKKRAARQVTKGRITVQQGLFGRGKQSSYVNRGLHISDEKKARIEEDLHRIIDLANRPSQSQTRSRRTSQEPRPLRLSSTSDSESVHSSCSQRLALPASSRRWKKIPKNSKSVHRATTTATEDSTLHRATTTSGAADSVLHRGRPTCSAEGTSGTETLHGRIKSPIVQYNTSSASSKRPRVQRRSSRLAKVRCTVSSDDFADMPLYKNFAATVNCNFADKLMEIFPGKDLLKDIKNNLQKIYRHSCMNSAIESFSLANQKQKPGIPNHFHNKVLNKFAILTKEGAKPTQQAYVSRWFAS